MYYLEFYKQHSGTPREHTYMEKSHIKQGYFSSISAIRSDSWLASDFFSTSFSTNCNCRIASQAT
jgi:hypothetical protein